MRERSLSRDVHSGQIVPRIGLRVSHALGIQHQLAEWCRPVVMGEEPGKRSGHDAFYPLHLVSGLDQVVERVYYRQAGSDGRLVQEASSALLAGLHHLLVVLVAGGTCLLVRGYDMEVPEPGGVLHGKSVARGAVDQHRMGIVRGADMPEEDIHVQRHGCKLERITPAGQVHTLL